MTDHEFEDILRTAVKSHGEDYFEKTAPSHEFSDRFNGRMEKIIHKKKRSGRIIKIICSAAAVFAVLVVSVHFLNLKNISGSMTSTVSQNAVKPDISYNAEKNDAPMAENDGDAYNAEPADNAVNEGFDDRLTDSVKTADSAEQNIPQNVGAAKSLEASEYPSAVIKHGGQTVSLGKDNTEKAVELIRSIISEGAVSEEQKAELSDENAEYVIYAVSADGQAFMTDDDGNALTSLTLYLDTNGTGVIYSEQTGDYYSIALSDPDKTYTEIKELIK